LYIVITSAVFLVLATVFVIQDIKSNVIKSNVSEFKAFSVLSDQYGGGVVFVPYGVELEGNVEGLDVQVVDTGNPQ
jgi:hypothetical protein